MPERVFSETTDRGRVDVLRDGTDAALTWTPHTSGATVELARIEPSQGIVRIFPKTPAGDEMEDQYTRIREFQIELSLLPSLDLDEPVGEGEYGEWVLAGLPRRFGSTFWMGLGLPRRYRRIIRVIEDHTDCTVVRFGPQGREGTDDEETFHISLERYDAYTVAVERTHGRGDTAVDRVNAAEAHNAVAGPLGLAPLTPHPGRHPMIQLLTRAVAGDVALDADDQHVLVESVRSASPRIASENPVAFGKLRDDIELVSLEELIKRYQVNLAREKREPAWQEFFKNNPFALQQMFAAPVILYGTELQVRYPNLFRRGGRIADFVLINTVTRSVYVVEIKTPGAGLTGKVYRGTEGSEVHLPGKDLAGAVAQVTAQVESARLEMAAIIEKTPGAETVDTLDVRGAVIVGRISELEGEQGESFRRFRTGLRDVDVLTFDEVLERLVGLREYLSTRDGGSASS
ncbi:DUF4263 domain-containing protein [Cellulomonas sp. JH27-2]|uniref:Shedu immune nuclease family protein n=1 Tax=Cellulomonas sp. JH27-2 TaxID=2774139 RepID=UPI0017870456|nr:Shedu immune nuclease family protein [Cellulomonas sp. JH27-2]MBD8059039.1 DUF4263 domain-containing protein [Cellulomonas sp. JH27-2]